MSKTRGKNRRPKTLEYDCLSVIDFPTFALAASQTNATPQAWLPLAANFKIAKVAVVMGGTTSAGTVSFNIVLGSAAEAGLASDDKFDTTGVYTPATAGQQVFSVDQAVTQTLHITQIFNSSVPEAIWPAGSTLTVRIATNASAANTENMTVLLYGKFTDINNLDPEAQTTAGGAPHTYQFGVDPL